MGKRLSAQEEKFAYLCLQGSLSNAYRMAYNIDKASTKSVNELASRKAKTQRIASRIAELKERQLSKLEDADVATAKERRAVLTAIIRDSQARHRDVVSAVHLLSQLEGEFSTSQSETTINVLELKSFSTEDLRTLLDTARREAASIEGEVTKSPLPNDFSPDLP